MSQPIIAGSPWPQNALEHIGACPACGHRGIDSSAYEGVVDVLGGTPGRWNLYECARCRSLYLNPRPAGLGIPLAYQTYYTHEREIGGDAMATNSIVGRLVAGYLSDRFGLRTDRALAAGRWLFLLIPPLRHQLDYFLRHLPRKPGVLLDVGCGNGAFLQRATKAGWDAEGIEPDESAARVARQTGCSVETETLDSYATSKRFDVVTMSHVIEHVPDPRRAVKKAYDILADGGMLWMATPNVCSPGRYHYGADWRGLEVPRHTAIFTAEALSNMLREAGYQQIRFHCRGRGARYSIVQSEASASRRGISKPRLPVWWVDLRAGISPRAGEEWVVTARKPQ